MWSGFIIRGNKVGLSRFHAAEFPRDVIPANAGIQFGYVVRSTQINNESFGRIFRLDSGVRRNDEL
jgi:hypothetical protein